MQPTKKPFTFVPGDFGEHLRSREATILAAGEINTQVKARQFNGDKFTIIFRVDRKRKPASYDGRRGEAELQDFQEFCLKLYRAASGLMS